MFARWRNLAAAAAGAICFPISLANASLQCDEFQAPHTPACTRTHDTSERDWFRHDRDAWYQRYYDSTIDEASPDYQSTPSFAEALRASGQPAIVISNIAPLDDEAFEDCNQDSELDLCDEMNAFDDDSADDEFADCDEWVPATDRPITTLETPQFDIESELFDIYTPEPGEFEPAATPTRTTPAAQLTGTIEAYTDDAELEWISEWFCGDRPDRDQQLIILDGVDPLPAPLPATPADDLDSFDLDDDAPEILFDPAPQPAPKFHMFYPGCDWSPYYPESQSGNPTPPALPEDLRSA